MELDKLKENWGTLNERIEQNEILNKRIIREMIQNRTNSAQSRLFRYDLFSLILVTLFCFLLPFLWIQTIMVFPSFLVLLGVMLFALCMEAAKLSCLLRFNIETKSLYELSRLTLRYQQLVKWNYTYGVLIAVLAVIAVFLFQGSNIYLDSWRIWVVCIAFAIGILLSFLQIRFQQKNIQSIKQGLKELEEFMEE